MGGRCPLWVKADMCSAQADVRFVPIADMHSIRLPGVYYFFLAVVVIGYETTATACWTLLFIVSAFFNDTITIAVWTGLSCVTPHGTLPHRRDFIRQCLTDPIVAAARRQKRHNIVWSRSVASPPAHFKFCVAPPLVARCRSLSCRASGQAPPSPNCPLRRPLVAFPGGQGLLSAQALC